MRSHWETIYTTRPTGSLSWHQPTPTLSLDLIRQHAKPSSRILDIGGGASSLAGVLADEGHHPTVLDISQAALTHARHSLPESMQNKITWLEADILTTHSLPPADLWHDRALFHFLTAQQDRDHYAALAERTLPANGILIIATFALDGPDKCSNLPVQRHTPQSLAAQFRNFTLLESKAENHQTPSGISQSFLYIVLRRN